MNRFDEITIGDLLRAFSRYRPFLLTIVGIALIAVVLPGARTEDEEDLATAVGTGPTQINTEGRDDTSTLATNPVADTGTDTSVAGTVSSGGGATTRRTGTAAGGSGTRTSAADSSASAPAIQGSTNPLDAPDCDPKTGRIKIPSLTAPNCVPVWNGGDNGGQTHPGVTKDTIKVVLYQAQEDAQSQAILAAAGASDDTSDQEDDENRNKVIEAFQAHYETYGRKVIWEKLEASGGPNDDAAAKADAIRAATEMKAFAVFGGPAAGAYPDELHARNVLCFCTVSEPIENYLARAPHVWSTLMASTQGYVHRAEYACRLHGGKAIRAGTAVMQQQPRKIALVYYETPDQQYRAGAQFFEREVAARCGLKLADNIAAVYNLNQEAENARVVIARLKEKGVTTVAFAGHPFQPIFLTKEATNQNYFPEWMITGSALTDTAFFARTYSPEQWRNAFGVSFLAARVTPEVADADPNIVEWHYGQELTSYPSILSFGQLFTGIHLAGPKLTPQTFRDGMFSFKPTPSGITSYAVSWGRGLWPWDDYLALDDTTEIWWDYDERGPDELQNEGVGMYRFVDMGKRHLPGQWPKGEPNVFTVENTVTLYRERPPQDQPPKYEHTDQHYRGTKK